MMPSERVDYTQVIGDYDCGSGSRRPNDEAGAAQIDNLMQSMKQSKSRGADDASVKP